MDRYTSLQLRFSREKTRDVFSKLTFFGECKPYSYLSDLPKIYKLEPGKTISRRR
jgi:hypothetical protein